MAIWAMAALMAKAAAAIYSSFSFINFTIVRLMDVLTIQCCALISNCLLIRESRELTYITMQGEM